MSSVKTRAKDVLRPIYIRASRAPTTIGWKATYATRRLAGCRGSLAVGPGSGFKTSAIRKICWQLGWNLTPIRTGREPLILFWPENEGPSDPQPPHWINGRCLNINKDRLATVFEEVFAIPYAIDPATATEPYVMKSVLNSAHDGRILTEPAPAKPGFFYCRLIDSVVDGKAIDFRIVYMRGVLELAFIKRRAITARFAATSASAEIVPARSLISDSEIQGIARMCELIGMDYGEIDAMRDRITGKLYVLDLNRQPAGPPLRLPTRQKRQAVATMARAFQKAFAPN